MKKFTALALATMLASTGAQALEAEKNIVNDALNGIQDAINDWMDSDEGDLWVGESEECYSEDNVCVRLYQGRANVSGNIGTPQYGSARSMAFTRALQDAQAQNAVGNYMDNAVNVISQLIQDTPKPEPMICDIPDPNDRLDLLKDKAIVFADRWMTRKLKEEGVPESEIPRRIDAIPTEQRLLQLEESIAQQSEMTAKVEDSGFIILNSWEAVDVNDQAAIGVVIASVPRIIQLLNTMKDAGGDFDPSHYDDLSTIPRVNESMRRYVRDELKDSFGARLVYNRQGYPTVVGIGQASPTTFTNDPALNQRHIRIAQETADQNARNAISQLFDMRTNVKISISEKSAFTQHAVAQYVGCNLEDFSDTESGSASYEKYLKVEHISKSGVQLEGLNMVRRDKYFNPNLNRDIYYTAYEWSPLTQRSLSTHRAASARTLQPNRPEPAPVEDTQQPVSSSGSTPVNRGSITRSKPALIPDF